MKVCKVCLKDFKEKHYSSKMCSDVCIKKIDYVSKLKYSKTDIGKEAHRRHRRTEKYKETQRKYRSTEKYKKMIKKAKDKYFAKVKDTKEYKEKVCLASKKRSYLSKSPLAGKLDFGKMKIKFGELNNLCQLCGTKDNITIDHIIPLSKGGTNLTSNLQPLCKSCNSSKKDRDWNYVKEIFSQARIS